MVGEERPREYNEPGPVDDLRQAGNEVGAIRVVTKEQAPFDTPHHDVVQGSRGIETRATRHGRHSTTTIVAKSI